MRDSDSREITRLLHRWQEGEDEALERLMPLVYAELHRVARAHLRRERPEHTLQPTEIVHEAFVKLVNLELSWQDRTHFLSMASRQMRRVLVDHARVRMSAKRGGGARPVGLDAKRVGLVMSTPERDWGVVELDDALRRLESVDSRQSRAVELHYFGGLGYEEIAQALDVSPATVGRDLRHARAWLRAELDEGRV